jgi:RNA polymerase sigma factor (sigma-70 family)
MEASALTSASRTPFLGRRSPLLRLQGDESLITAIREGNEAAFEILINRYRTRLLAYCQHMLGSREDGEDILQEVFTAAHAAILSDDRTINARPWLYRIARNRCLNHLRKPVADGQDSMDLLPHANGASTAELAQDREQLREIVADVRNLPETQRTALVLREIDDLSYDEIAVAMETTVSAVKSLLVRARMGLAEASEGRILTCDDVRLQLAESAEGLRKVSGPARHHLRDCADCRRYREGMRTSTKALAALAPLGLLGVVRELVFAKLGGGAASSAGSGGAAAGGGGSCAAGGGAAASGGAAAAGGGAAAGSGIAAAGSGAAAGAGGAIGSAGALAGGAAAGGLGGVLGGKAAAGVATAALLTAGAAGVAERIGIPEGRSDSPAKTSAPADEGASASADPAAPASAHNAEGEAAGAGSDGAAAEGTAPPADAAPTTATPKGRHHGRHGRRDNANGKDENPMSGGGGDGDQPPPVVGGGDPPPPPPPPPPDDPPPPPPPADPPPPPPAA